jgi:hypothetical protein
MNKNNLKKALLFVIFALFFAGVRLSSRAQFDRIKDAAGKLGKKAPDASSLLEGEPPITTSLSDAIYGDSSRDGYNPSSLVPLTSLARTSNGGFILRPGLYEMHTQSYCLKAGTHGPGGGDGYLYAPPKGPARDAVVSIVRNSVQHAEIDQHKIQLLLWAIIARAKFENLNPELKAVASQLLTPQQLAMLNRSGLSILPGPAHDRLMQQVPPSARHILEAEARLRQMLTTGASFEEMERVAVLAGAASMGEGSRQVPWGRWSRHPDGYYVRYLPRSYNYTVVQIFVPEGSPAVGKEYDPALHIAVPGNTARQRLIQSGRAQSNWPRG